MINGHKRTNDAVLPSLVILVTPDDVNNNNCNIACTAIHAYGLTPTQYHLPPSTHLAQHPQT